MTYNTPHHYVKLNVYGGDLIVKNSILGKVNIIWENVYFLQEYVHQDMLLIILMLTLQHQLRSCHPSKIVFVLIREILTPISL